MKRNSKGSIVTFLMILGIIGFTLVVGLLGTELLIRWVSLSRVQNAAREAVVVYARDMIRLRDNALSVARKSQLSFAESGVSQDCSMGGCTAPIGAAAAVPGATSMEYLNASRTFLYNIWHKRLEDPAQVDDVRQFQCYKPYEEMRFAKIESAPPTCEVTGKVSSPITGLNWTFTTNPYGSGVCCPSGSANDTNKDFCVQMKVRGRMDPVIAGGLPFLSQKGVFSEGATASNGRERMPAVSFITVGEFDISVRAVANKMSAAEGTGDGGNASNLSGETIYLEDFAGGATCGVAPSVSPLAIAPPIPKGQGIVSPPNVPALPPDEIVPAQLKSPSIPAPVPSCPGGYQVSGVISNGSGGTSFSCSRIPPPPPPTPSTSSSPASPPSSQTTASASSPAPALDCDKFKRAIASAGSLNMQVSKLTNVTQLSKDPRFGEGGSSISFSGAPIINTEADFYKITKAGACSPTCGCFCGANSSCFQVFGFNSPLVVSIGGKPPRIEKKIIEFSYDGKKKVKTHWLANGDEFAFLFVDLNANKIADNGTELFGPHFGGVLKLSRYSKDAFNVAIYKDGYEALRRFSDKNGDGKIAGTELDGLKLWFDGNGNGICELYEVKELSDIGIVMLETRDSLVNAKSWYGENGFAEPSVSRGYKTIDGKYGSTYDLWFKEEAQ